MKSIHRLGLIAAATLLACSAQAQLLDLKPVQPSLISIGDKLVQLLAPALPEGLTKGQNIPDRYIVVLKGLGSEKVDDVVARLTSIAGVTPHFVYRNGLTGFAATLTPGALKLLQSSPLVDFIEADQVVSTDATQDNVDTWGLDRIDSRALVLDKRYTYENEGSGVSVYVVDTGILPNHNDFTGRVVTGYTAINDGRGSVDCNGHGTHVAGTVGGSSYGVAKRVTLVPVRVLGCNGSGSNSGVIAGVDWAVGNAKRGSVINMSLGGGASAATDAAIDRAVAAGITAVVAAGNSNTNACNSSPARAAKAITVGATAQNDSRASYSNFGSCLDIFAPGSAIKSAWFTSATATSSLSGTSMASPHVAGVAALVSAANPGFTPDQVTNAIVAGATRGLVTGAGAGSPNVLLYSLASTKPADETTPPPPPPVEPPPPPPPPPPPAPPPVVEPVAAVSGLSGSSTRTLLSGWRANVTITIRNSVDGKPLPNATVSGQFGSAATVNCQTGSTGSCQVQSASLPNSPNTVTYRVTRVAPAAGTYDASKNTVSSITVTR